MLTSQILLRNSLKRYGQQKRSKSWTNLPITSFTQYFWSKLINSPEIYLWYCIEINIISKYRVLFAARKKAVLLLKRRHILNQPHLKPVNSLNKLSDSKTRISFIELMLIADIEGKSCYFKRMRMKLSDITSHISSQANVQRIIQKMALISVFVDMLLTVDMLISGYAAYSTGNSVSLHKTWAWNSKL